MDKNEIIEYVMNTPHNTNRAVLNSMLNQLGGGSGSSDFSTATVTVEYIMPEGVSDVGELTEVTVYSLTDSAHGVHGITYQYGEGFIPLSDVVSGNQINIPLYKDYPSDLYVEFDNANYYSVMDDSSQVVSGDATISGGYFLITGDCSLRVTLIAND